MLQWLSCWLTISLALASEPPFWKAKPKVYDRIKDGEVIVSVRATDVSPAKPRYDLHAGGGAQVNAPCNYVFTTAQKYDQLPRASEYIKRTKFDTKTQVLDMDLEAYSHSANLRVELKPSTAAAGETRIIEYKVVGGPMTGYAGKVDFTKIDTRKCEVGFVGEYKYDRFPIPRMFLEFGMEVVLQRMAARLRAFTEDEYREGLRKDAKP